MEKLKTLRSAAGPRRYLLGSLTVAVVSFFDWIKPYFEGAGMTQLIGVPSWAVGIVVALCFVCYWLLDYAHKLRVGIELSRVELSRLRRKGVSLRNTGRSKITNNDEWFAWETETIEWQKEVYESLKKISMADAEWFDTMDVVPPPRLNLENRISDAHQDRFWQHDYQVKRLGEMIRDLWGK